jgi:peptide/nickel transport system permease protein
MLKLIFTALLRLIAQAGFVAFAVGILSFLLMRSLPGDAAFRIAAGRYGYDMVDAASAEAVRKELGLDQSGWQQLLNWLGDLLQFRLGESMVSGIPVMEEIGYQLGATLQLSVAAWLMALTLGCALGVLSVLRGGWLARGVDALCTLLRASPSFLIGVVLMLLLAVHLKWLPVAGHGEPDNMVLPALTLALALGAGIAQVVRYRLLQVMTSDAFEYAQTKGLPLRSALWRHAAPAVALPALAYAGVQLVLLIEGVVVVESLFAWPGIGHALLHAVVSRDVPMIQGTALVMALMFVVFNAAIDLIVMLLDPRLRSARMQTATPSHTPSRAPGASV